MGYKILVFSWNTESVSLCETLDPAVAQYNRSGSSSLFGYGPTLTTWRYPCEVADFYDAFSKLIVGTDPDLVVIGFQEDRYPGSYFHSHLLPAEMPKIGYELVKRSKLMGVGITSYKGTLAGDPKARGLRISVYAKSSLANSIQSEEDSYLCSSMVTRGKGAIAVYIQLPDVGKIAFICCHLPFNSKSLITERKYHNKMLRQNELNSSNVCFNNIIENLVLFKEHVPTHVVYFGDFNYRLSDLRPASVLAEEFSRRSTDDVFIRNTYMAFDELRQQMRKENIYEMSEGPGNHGPPFLPTCKMTKGRDTDGCSSAGTITPECWKLGKEDQRVPSYCDRILHGKMGGDDKHNLLCTYYDKYDTGTVMAKSDHAAVMGIFELI